MIHYRISHSTTYAYSDPVSLCQNVAHLMPRVCGYQETQESTLFITPEPAVLEERIDYFGNPILYFTIQEPHRELSVKVEHLVTVEPNARRIEPQAPAWELVRDQLHQDRSPDWLDANSYLYPSRHVTLQPRYAEYASVSFTPGRSIVEASMDLTQRIFKQFVYDSKATTIATPIAEVFERRRGVCQDFAHIQLACLRSLGIAARYVSGYLSTVTPPGKVKLVGADATHAWVSVFCGDAGWVDFDPTNNLRPTERHILLAWGRDFDDVSPLKGVILGGGHHSVHVSVDVSVIPEA